MGYEKFFLKSVTIVAAIAVMLVQLLPMIGVNFSADDAALVTESWDGIISALLALIAIYGRVTATTTLTTKVNQDNKLHSPLWAVALAILLVAACTPTTKPGSPSVRLYQVEANFAIVKEEAALYASRPFCSDTVIVMCADPATVVKLDNISDQVEGYIDQGRVYVKAFEGGNPAAPNAGAIDLASSTLRLLITVVASAMASGA